jgi:hypothetical protein
VNDEAKPTEEEPLGIHAWQLDEPLTRPGQLIEAMKRLTPDERAKVTAFIVPKHRASLFGPSEPRTLAGLPVFWTPTWADDTRIGFLISPCPADVA